MHHQRCTAAQVCESCEHASMSNQFARLFCTTKFSQQFKNRFQNKCSPNLLDIAEQMLQEELKEGL